VKETNLTGISDEIYEKMVFDGRKHVSIGSFKGIRDQVVTVNGVSKAYAMTGWRIGYMGGPEEIIRAAGKVQGQVTNNANSIAQKATVAALRGPQGPIDAMRDEFQLRRDYILRRLPAWGGGTALSPEGAMFFFLSVEHFFGLKARGNLIRGDRDVVEHLLEHHHVALVPGDAFGAPGHIRLSFAASMADLEKGMDRLLRGLQEIQ
jgi:aspartate aminotransferase